MADRRQLLAVMFTDIVGFSAMTAADEATTVRVVREHRDIVRERLSAYGGREMRTIGDAFLVLFESAVEAVRCAVDIQERMAARNQGLPEKEQVWMRIGVHAGEVLYGAEGELYGDTVNLAARVEPLAPPGGVCVTDVVHAQLRAHVPVRFEPMGVVPLKNIADPPALFRLAVGKPAPAMPKPRPSRAPALAVATALIGMGLGAAWWWGSPRDGHLASDVPEAQALYEDVVKGIRGGDLDHVRDFAERAVALDPEASQLWLARALTCGDAVVATDALAKASKLAPTGSEGDLERLVHRSRIEPDSPAVAAAWDAWGAAHPDDEHGQFLRAIHYPAHGHDGPESHARGVHDHASTVELRRFVERFPDHVMARWFLGNAERGDGDPEAARAQFEESLRRCTKCASAHQAFGDHLRAVGDLVEAEHHYRSSLELEPGLPGNRENLADLALMRGDEPERARRVEALLADDGPARQKYLFAFSHGSLLLYLGRRTDGLELVERGLALASDDPATTKEVLRTWASAHALFEDAEGMARIIDRYREELARPELPGLLRDVGAIEVLTMEVEQAFVAGDADRARRVYARMAALPDERFAGLNRDQTLKVAEHFALLAEGDWDAALAISRGLPEGCFRSFRDAQALAPAGRAEEARAAWKGVVEQQRCDEIVRVRAWVALAEDALARGDQAAAKEAIAQYREIWPAPDADLPPAVRAARVEAALGSE
jgi:class 3 adenylate cyclase/tetratricopeptide (TPR) repeat protein